MRFIKTVAPAMVLAILTTSTAACTVTTESGTKPDDARFLEALSGPIRDKYQDSALLAEGQKVCDAFAKGQTEDQAKQMIAKDLGVDSGQFIGAVYAGNLCSPHSGK